MNLRFREPRIKSEKHLKFVRGLSCVVCHDNTSTEAAHVRFACNETGKRQTGKSEKPSDKWTVPLCGRHHRDQHSMNEQEFWLTVGIVPINVALKLWNVTGNHEEGERIVLSAHVST
jgi:hypothetical protein